MGKRRGKKTGNNAWGGRGGRDRDDDFPMRQDELDLRAKPAVKQQDEWGGMDVDMDMD